MNLKKILQTPIKSRETAKEIILGEIWGTEEEDKEEREQEDKPEPNIAPLREEVDETRSQSGDKKPKRIIEKYLETLRFHKKSWPPTIAWHLAKKADSYIQIAEFESAGHTADLLGYQIKLTKNLTAYQARKNKLKLRLNGKSCRLIPKTN